MTNTWRDIPGLEGIYQANVFGEIKSLSRYVRHPKGGLKKIKERILSKNKSTNGYFIVGISQNGGTTSKTVHRLVAQAFIPNPDNLPEVNHIDGDKLNNNVSNLEWATVSENRFHAYRTGLQKAPYSMLGKRGKDCPNSVAVFMILGTGKKRRFHSTTIAMQKTKVDRSLISKCASGKISHAGGYKWEYA